jgi:Holin of 3TMs, for gene-transfer release
MGLDITGIGSVADLVKDAIDKIFPNPTEAAAAKVALFNAQSAGTLKQLDDDFQTNLEQIKANAAEAATPGFHFRDGAGWVCVAMFAIATLKAPIEWAATLFGHPITLPSVDTSVSTTMLFALLGLGGMHTFEQTSKK